jgi:hypothetical protein
VLVARVQAWCFLTFISHHRPSDNDVMDMHAHHMCQATGVSYLLWCNVKPHTICSYGIVWQGRWKHKSGHKTVAVKVLKAASIDECPDEFAQEDFRKEVATLKAIRYRTS